MSGKTLLVCAVMGAAVFAVNTLLDRLAGPSAGTGGRESLLHLFVTGVLFAPLVEEFFFRGVVYNLLCRFRGGWTAVLLSAAVFGLYHMDFYQAVYTAILGIVLALVYQRTQNILYPIAIHMANNACACLAVSGLPEPAQKLLGTAAAAMVLPAAVLLMQIGRPRRDAPAPLPDESVR